jgi:hypothetical protein
MITETATPFAFPVFWRMSQEPEAVASSCASASLNLRSENVLIYPVIVAKMEPGNRHKG